MSDIIPPDAALVAISARITELNAEIEQHAQAARVATAIRDELADLAAVLGRKPRVRKVRPVTEAVTETAEEAPRATVFAAPCVSGDTAEAA